MNKNMRDALEWYACLLVGGEESEISDFYETLKGMCDGDYLKELDDLYYVGREFRSKKENLLSKFEEVCI